LQADLEAGYQTTERLRALFAQIESDGFPDGVQLIIKGEAEDQQETMVFLVKAFGLAIFLMTIILVTQFNSFYQTFTVLSAIIFSSAGLFLSLLIRGQPFGIVMSGLGMIALAGIVVNNNIVLIDTLNSLRKQGLSMIDAMIETCSQRFRPIMLTTITTILGLVPMAIGMSINILGRELDFGAPSTQMWTQLASSIAGGLSFATLLTLFITPSMLILGDKISSHFSNKRKENSNKLDTDLLAEKN
jgi:multidrug efflux pump